MAKKTRERPFGAPYLGEYLVIYRGERLTLGGIGSVRLWISRRREDDSGFDSRDVRVYWRVARNEWSRGRVSQSELKMTFPKEDV